MINKQEQIFAEKIDEAISNADTLSQLDWRALLWDESLPLIEKYKSKWKKFIEK